ncbi:MAG: RsmB/NOP family class I SAM-dependent RNA methyltransferase [Verrucomicrobia bacterium]|nr:RsmB/NOP family class I SAM-dependent RNA methyltransferase [Verrucomicrobiota bacterium]
MSAATPSAAWLAAVNLLARWLERRERLDALLDTLPASLAGAERARCQHLVFGVVRHFGRLESALGRLIAHPPRFSTRAVLFVAGFELIEAQGSPEADGMAAKIVHHAVEQTKTLSSPAESRLVNAVVRKLVAALAAPAPAQGKGATADPAALAEYFSHPEWLVRMWLRTFGPEATRQLLEWNQQPATVYARWRGTDAAEARPDFLKPTQWDGFFEVESGKWTKVEPLLRSGKIYLQDPGTRLAIGLLAPQAGETVLDVCAAPGGKSLLIADTMKTGKVVAMDLPGARIDRLKENLSRANGVEVALVQMDVLAEPTLALREHGLPESFSAVLIDVPCSNTGVMRHRADVKWRLQEGDFKKHPKQQLALLHAAARLVAPGGRLVYSTCSIDPVENEKIITEFFNSRAGGPFKLEASVQSLPWVTGHDGAGAFLLRRS